MLAGMTTQLKRVVQTINDLGVFLSTFTSDLATLLKKKLSLAQCEL